MKKKFDKSLPILKIISYILFSIAFILAIIPDILILFVLIKNITNTEVFNIAKGALILFSLPIIPLIIILYLWIKNYKKYKQLFYLVVIVVSLIYINIWALVWYWEHYGGDPFGGGPDSKEFDCPDNVSISFEPLNENNIVCYNKKNNIVNFRVKNIGIQEINGIDFSIQYTDDKGYIDMDDMKIQIGTSNNYGITPITPFQYSRPQSIIVTPKLAGHKNFFESEECFNRQIESNINLCVE